MSVFRKYLKEKYLKSDVADTKTGDLTVLGHIGINTNAETNNALRVEVSSGAINTLRIGRQDTASFWIVNHAGNDFRLFNNGGVGSDVIFSLDSASIDRLNKVGIGITPTERLSVNGNIFLSVQGTTATNNTIRNSGTTLIYKDNSGVEWDLLISTPTKVKVSLSAAQIKTLNSVPVTLVSAPSAGKFIQILNANVKLNYGTVAFTNSQINLEINGANVMLRTNTLNQTANLMAYLQPQPTSATTFENQALNISSTADSAVGDGTVDIYLTYQIIDL